MLEEKIKEDLINALKSQNAEVVGTLRMLMAAMANRAIEKRGKGGEPILTDEETLEVLMKEAKKRKEAAEIYSQGGRSELAQKELKEYEIVKKYLPEQLSQEELEKIVDAVLAQAGVKEIKEMGKALGEIMKQVKGKAEPRVVSELVKKKLGS